MMLSPREKLKRILKGKVETEREFIAKTIIFKLLEDKKFLCWLFDNYNILVEKEKDDRGRHYLQVSIDKQEKKKWWNIWSL